MPDPSPPPPPDRTIDAELRDSGSYARKQLGGRFWFLSWSHGSRFRLGRRLAAPFAGGRLLDYGCGDGAFLATVRDLFPEAVGADVSEDHLRECRVRFASVPGYSFRHCSELADPAHTGAYALVTCMEVMEHCVPEVARAVIADLRRLVAPTGTALVSVPIETGPSLVVKQLLRRAAGWWGLGDYRHTEHYRFGEFWQMVFATDRSAIDRPVYGADAARGEPGYHGHKGFNWRALRRQLAGPFEVCRTSFSPLGWLGGLVSSQAWFACRPRAEPGSINGV
jgi:SAM-dependent methyltransferase